MNCRYLSICMITRCACVRTYVRTVARCPEAQRDVPVDHNITKRGHIVVVLSYHTVEAERPRSLEQTGPGTHGYRQRR